MASVRKRVASQQPHLAVRRESSSIKGRGTELWSAAFVLVLAALVSGWAARTPGAWQHDSKHEAEPELEAERVNATVEFTIRRDLGFMDEERLQQLEDLIDVDGELHALPVPCAACRIAALEAFAAGVSRSPSASPPR